jgi:hypothetical protein
VVKAFSLSGDQPGQSGIQVHSSGDVFADGDRATYEKLDFRTDTSICPTCYLKPIKHSSY